MPAARPAPAARPRQYLVIDLKSFYADVTDIDKGGNCYYHVIYYGEIVDSYIVR